MTIGVNRDPEVRTGAEDLGVGEVAKIKINQGKMVTVSEGVAVADSIDSEEPRNQGEVPKGKQKLRKRRRSSTTSIKGADP